MKRILALALSVLVWTQPTPAPAQAPAQVPTRAAIEEIVRDLIRREPEIVLEALEALEKRRDTAQAEQAKRALAERRRELENDPDAPVAGNPRGTVVVVEFFDYRCQFCKRMHEPVKQMLAADRDVRLVRRDLPILGPASVVAARAALAARAQGPQRYEALHEALMTARGNLDEAAVFRLAAEAGLDVARLRRDMEDPRVAALLRRNADLAQALNITGTPGYAIGEALVPGAVDLGTLRALVAEARTRAPR
ncbi:MAG: DsbA family protein [Azospirillum sp.]|nr:DsbA family protein [Azospirillum sp.]MCA3265989.1 DsbA family protein [Azospirillum sp.]MCZ8123010.1 DsbA family protein [Magnetospirillum sp.]